jgi:hypothetical protein
MPVAAFFLLLGGVLFYRLGQHEYGKGFLVAALSILAGVITLLVFRWGPFGYVAGQVLLFGGLTWYNMRYRPPGRRG